MKAVLTSARSAGEGTYNAVELDALVQVHIGRAAQQLLLNAELLATEAAVVLCSAQRAAKYSAN